MDKVLVALLRLLMIFLGIIENMIKSLAYCVHEKTCNTSTETSRVRISEPPRVHGNEHVDSIHDPRGPRFKTCTCES